MNMQTEIPTISADRLCALTGFTDRRHRQLAKDGYFPPPINGEYPLNQTVAGLFRYFRETGKTGDELRAEQIRNLRLDAQAKERLAKIEKKELVRMSEVEQRIIERLVIPLTESLEGMATACAQLANPTDPNAAHAAINGYLERTLKPYLRSKLNL